MKKNLILFLTLVLSVLSASAQSQYEKEMKKAISLLDKAEKIEELRDLSNRLERISRINSEVWLPHYYRSYIYVKMNYLTKNNEEKDKLLDKAQEEYEKILKLDNTEQDEIMVLYAYILQAKFSVNYQSRLSLNTEALNILQEVITKYPSNPRAYLLKGIATYKMPAFIGGSKKDACEMFNEANKLFISTETKPLMPNWGRELNDIWLKRCQEDNIM